MALVLNDYAYDGDGAGVSLGSVGLAADVLLRGVYPIPGGFTLVVTETGAFLYQASDMTLINKVRITNRISQLAPFSELSVSWASEACAVPVFHYNVNLMADGRAAKYPYGWLVVRRRADLEVVDEDRGEQGVVTRTYASWAIHFDPFDFSEPGPIVGEFHWLRDSTNYSPAEYALQEVTFIDGASTSGYLDTHQDGYAEKDFELSGAFSDSVLCDPSRFWDSYAAFRVLIAVDHLHDWQYVDRSPLSPPRPRTKSAYLIYTNAGARGLADPPMKLVRMHHVGGLSDVADPFYDSLTLGKFAGAEYLRKIQYDKLPIGLPFITGNELGPRNYLYSNLYPELTGGTRDETWEAATLTVPRDGWINVQNQWSEQIWHTYDKPEYEPGRVLGVPVGYPGRVGLQSFEWQPWLAEDFERSDILGTWPSKPLEAIVIGAKQWTPGWLFGLEIDRAAWNYPDVFLPGPPPPSFSVRSRIIEDRTGDFRGAYYKNVMLTARAFASPNHANVAHSKAFTDGSIAVGISSGPVRPPWLSVNPLRGWDRPRLVYWTISSEFLTLEKRAIIHDLTSFGPYKPTPNQQTYSLVLSHEFLTSGGA